ncbi:riboflavin deaminase [Falsirhodobacter algicola]|uniref:Riboflavin deaminase n=2 Tax=Falsirhodobacter algicola TaxID=2692330 RepID=A0A8J8SLS2_9RHOB|nr:riboflavin deaminase [Falsirhodobacter algicola]
MTEPDRPFVVGQVGQSLDGRVATVDGDSRDISGADGLRHLHRLRALADAVVLGVGTVIADDPRLSVRLVPGPSPVRVVIDCHGVMPRHARMLHDQGAPVILIRAEDAPPAPPGTDVIALPRQAGGLCPAAILDALAARGLHRILIEGGARTTARFLDAGLLDRLHVTVAPLIIGSGPTGITLPPVATLAEAHRPEMAVYDIGTDILFDCTFARSGLGHGKDVEMADDAGSLPAHG